MEATGPGICGMPAPYQIATIQAATGSHSEITMGRGA